MKGRPFLLRNDSDCSIATLFGSFLYWAESTKFIEIESHLTDDKAIKLSKQPRTSVSFFTGTWTILSIFHCDLLRLEGFGKRPRTYRNVRFQLLQEVRRTLMRIVKPFRFKSHNNYVFHFPYFPSEIQRLWGRLINITTERGNVKNNLISLPTVDRPSVTYKLRQENIFIWLHIWGVALFRGKTIQEVTLNSITKLSVQTLKHFPDETIFLPGELNWNWRTAECPSYEWEFIVYSIRFNYFHRR